MNRADTNPAEAGQLGSEELAGVSDAGVSDADRSATAIQDTASLLDRLDKEQDQVLRELNDLNDQIELLISEHATSRRDPLAAPETAAPETATPDVAPLPARAA